jgi:hypothetical protein
MTSGPSREDELDERITLSTAPNKMRRPQTSEDKDQTGFDDEQNSVLHGPTFLS